MNSGKEGAVKNAGWGGDARAYYLQNRECLEESLGNEGRT